MQYQAGAKRPNYLLPKGEYSAKILEAEEKTSKVKPDGGGGNPMLVLKLEVYNEDHTKFVNDYIVTGGAHPQDWKIGHLIAACGLPDSGSISPADIVERYVRVKVKVKPAKGDYQEDNAIDDYLEKQAGDVTQAETRASNLPPSIKSAIGGGASDSEPPFAPHDKWSWG